MRSIAIPAHIRELCAADKNTDDSRIDYIRKNYKISLEGKPEVSVVIPAYNEENNILKTLHSLTANQTKRSVEIIVVNNNSVDNTEFLVRAAGVTCINESKQGITAARNAGLAAASGTYIMNADADTVYPKDWIEKMVSPLVNNSNISVTYGNFSFIPTGNTSRFTYFFYEYVADIVRYMNKVLKDEAMNAYGFNSCFRREQGLKVDGYNHPKGANEDGWLALKLRDGGYGKLHKVNHTDALVWTTDRRIQMDGGIMNGIIKRMKRVILNKGEEHSGL